MSLPLDLRLEVIVPSRNNISFLRDIFNICMDTCEITIKFVIK